MKDVVIPVSEHAAQWYDVLLREMCSHSISKRHPGCRLDIAATRRPSSVSYESDVILEGSAWAELACNGTRHSEFVASTWQFHTGIKTLYLGIVLCI